MSAQLAELRRTFHDQVEAFASEVESRISRLEPSKSGLRGALEVLGAYPDAVTKSLARQSGNQDEADQLLSVRDHLSHVQSVWAIFEQWFGRGRASGFPRSLARAIDDELKLCGSRRNAVLAIGPPAALETWIPDLYDQVFGGLAGRPPASLRRQRFAMIQIPRLQGLNARWRPLIMGHELMHLLLEDKGKGLRAVDISDHVGNTNGIRIPKAVLEFHGYPENPYEAIGRSWFEEMLCDAYAVRRFGPAAIAAFAAFFDDGIGEEDHSEHPPSTMRLHVMLHSLPPLSEAHSDADRNRLSHLLAAAEERAASSDRNWPRWVRELTHRILPLAYDIPTLLNGWPGHYDRNERAAQAIWVADRLKAGLPSDAWVDGKQEQLLSSGDILNGAWLAWSEGARAPTDRLALKSLETIEFDELWDAVKRQLPRVRKSLDRNSWQIPKNVGTAEYGGILPNREIAQRLEQGPGQIHVIPRPQKIEGAAMDVRLGNRFIVFEPSGIAAFDPINSTTDPRVIQGSVDKDWGEPFVLHPGDLVLAATHEYVALPGDLSCLLITRSSYGRLGLVTATAVLVHPYFHGCLTLELANLGTVPLILSPGERIAQLIFMRVYEPVGVPEDDQKYRCPTGPEFSKIHRDPEARIISEISHRRLRVPNLEPK